MTNELKKAIETVKAYLDMDSDVDSEYLNAQRTIIKALEAQPTSDDEIIKALKAVRTIHNGNYAPQIDEAIRRLEAQPTDGDCISRKAVIELIGGDYGKWLPQAIMELPPVTSSVAADKDGEQ